ncbi:hypothetical protein DSAG12_00754 [Promethearchaeum syntrophicum]|uniref:Uncharacterized protein n=1 Tax=Promethearchaeum syntrophicum TaxID=2594042 RepID=A0A5B9D786_9ARCH|nr:hypothetical protein [Candidatus Prometheoarchaeum syntrophicum]QEE14932.1 hypothetical protein DSAG12_00754 [Candidatus Prometheoarchaeum syntrophicum]
MTEESKTLYFCSECMHIYYKIPSNNQCAICHNEMNVEDRILPSSLDIFTCETCHTLYSTQNFEDLIPTNIENKNFLCACKHHCPTNALLQIGKEEAYIGNIVIADIFNCSNCGAISYRNPDNQQRSCAECGSRFVIPLNWDPKTQKTFFSCANKQTHGIRLKIRDLILNNNKIISEEIKNIKVKEKQLQNQYEQRRARIITNFGKKKKKLEKEINSLNLWAIEQRREMYNYLRPIGLRCTVFKMEKEENKILYKKTNDGCGALAHLKIRKIILAPDGTVIDRAPPKPDEPIIEETETPKIMHVDQLTLALKNTPMEPLSNNLSQTNLYEKQDIFKKITSTDDKENQLFNSLPILKDEQIYIKIGLYSLKYLSDKVKRINSGVIPIKIKKDINEFKIGREQIIRAYWTDIELFKENPLIFDSLTKVSENSDQFRLQKDSEGFFVSPGENQINKIFYSSDDENSDIIELTTPMSLNMIKALYFYTYYSFDKENVGMDHQFIFKLSIALPESSLTT